MEWSARMKQTEDPFWDQVLDRNHQAQEYLDRVFGTKIRDSGVRGFDIDDAMTVAEIIRIR